MRDEMTTSERIAAEQRRLSASETKLKELESERERIAAGRTGLLLAADDGDAKAQAAVAKADERLAELARQTADTESVIAGRRQRIAVLTAQAEGERELALRARAARLEQEVRSSRQKAEAAVRKLAAEVAPYYAAEGELAETARQLGGGYHETGGAVIALALVEAGVLPADRLADPMWVLRSVAHAEELAEQRRVARKAAEERDLQERRSPEAVRRELAYLDRRERDLRDSLRTVDHPDTHEKLAEITKQRTVLEGLLPRVQEGAA
jgi:hypothetical protein